MTERTEQRQTDFNTVWTAFVVEKKPQALAISGRCAYNGHEGAHCGYGVCLTEDELSLIYGSLEGKRASVVIEDLLIKRHMGDGEFYDVLQRCHDLEWETGLNDFPFDSPFPEHKNFNIRIKKRLRFLAEYYDLEVPA